MRIDQGFPVFYGKDGALLKSGKVYVGTPGLDAETNAVPLFYDAARTVPAPNPVTVQKGIVTKAGLPVPVFVNGEFSITVRDDNGVLQFKSLNGSPIQATDIATSLTPQLDAYFVKRAGDVMTGPLVIGAAVNANDLYSRSQLDNILKLRNSATYVVDSVQKWVDLGLASPGNDFTDVLVKRGTWNVDPITLPATCMRFRGELGAELEFNVSLVSYYGVMVADKQTTEISDLLFTLHVAQDLTLANIQKSAIVGRDCFVHDIEVAFIIQGGSMPLGTVTLIGASTAKASDITVNAYNVDIDSFTATNCLIVGVDVLLPTDGALAQINNVSLSQFGLVTRFKKRYGVLSCVGTVTQIFVNNPTLGSSVISWKTPKVVRVGLGVITASTLHFIRFTGAPTTNRFTQVILEGALNIVGSVVNVVMFRMATTTAHRVSVQYKLVLNYSASIATHTANDTPTIPIQGVTGSIGVNADGALTVVNLVSNASGVNVMLNVANALTTTQAIKNSKQVRNCIVKINAGSAYGADVYYSSDTTALASNAAIGGWNSI